MILTAAGIVKLHTVPMDLLEKSVAELEKRFPLFLWLSDRFYMRLLSVLHISNIAENRRKWHFPALFWGVWDCVIQQKRVYWYKFS